MIVNRYVLDNRISEADKNRLRQNCVKSYRNHILRIIDKEYCQVFEKNYLFSSVEIETINRCNGSCPFCPVNRRDDIREYAKMQTDLFLKIIDELGEMNYQGRIALHSNNEPFLDDRMVEFAAYARVKVPHAYIYLYTNGTLLNTGLLKSILPYLDRIYIDNYDDELKLHENVLSIHRMCQKDPAMDKKVIICLRKINEVLTTRGGMSPNNSSKIIHDNLPCILPFRQLVIRPDGKISLCCNDPYGKYTLGESNVLTLRKIWFSDSFDEIRRKIMTGRHNLEYCRYCDNLPNIYSY